MMKYKIIGLLALLLIINLNLVVAHGQEITLELQVKQGFPQGSNYVFECLSVGWQPSTYSWFYGDGSKQNNILNDNTWHTYLANGDYSVSCTAKTEGFFLSAFLDVKVTGVEVETLDDPEDSTSEPILSSGDSSSSKRGSGGRREWVIDDTYFLNDSVACVKAHYRVRELHRVSGGVINVFDHRYSTTMTKCLLLDDMDFSYSAGLMWGVWGLVE